MALKDDIIARIATAADGDDAPAPNKTSAVTEKLTKSLGTLDIHYVRYGNKFRLFVLDNGKMRTVTMIIGRYVPSSGWKDDTQGGWITCSGGDPTHSLEMRIEKYLPGIRLHEITRLG